MYCPECNTKFNEPTYVDEIAYFVCETCGFCLEKPGYVKLTLEEKIKKFEDENKVKLPKEYLEFDKRPSGLAFKNPNSSSPNIQYYNHNKYWTLEQFINLDPEERGISIFDNDYLIKEWDLPSGIILIAGSGHYWYALDYRRNSNQPEVIFIESENADFEIIGKSFKDFINSLVPYKEEKT